MIKLGYINKITLAVGFMSMAYANNALAEINWRGYATIAGGQTFDDVNYNSLTDDFRLSNLSLVGLQGTSELSDGLTATVQLVARGKNDFEPKVEWAFIKYQVNDNLDIKAGRLRAPFYFYSEYLDVSYAYSWISPPIEVYAGNITNYDGVSIYYSGNVGGFDYSLYLGTGSRDTVLSVGDISAKYNILTNFDISYGDFKTKLIYSDYDLSITSNTVIAVQQLFPDLPGAFLMDEAKGTIAGIAAYYDPGNFYLGIEYADLAYKDIIITAPEDVRFLATAGYRFNEYTLHYSYSTSDKSNSLDKVAQSDPRYAIAKSVSNAVLSEDETHILGLRYDFHSNAAFKLEYGITDNAYTNQDTQFLRTGVSIVF